MPDFASLAKAYGVDGLIDYERGSGLLLSSGAGTMMAVMDLCPSLRWCLDIDANRTARLGGLLTWATRLCSPIVIAGWFSITSPTGLARAIDEALENTRGEFTATVYAAPDVTLSQRLSHVRSLEELAARVESPYIDAAAPRSKAAASSDAGC